jgi:hypothetical protein
MERTVLKCFADRFGKELEGFLAGLSPHVRVYSTDLCNRPKVVTKWVYLDNFFGTLSISPSRKKGDAVLIERFCGVNLLEKERGPELAIAKKIDSGVTKFLEERYGVPYFRPGREIYRADIKGGDKSYRVR